MEKITYRKTLDAHKNGIQFTLQGFETADNMSRVIEINLMASGDTVDIPLEGVVAMMYVITPSAKEPSINYCSVRGNTVVYEVQPITEEGMTEMQLKLIQSDINGATKVLISPRFAVEVMRSNADDGDAEQTATFTALENAVAKAEAVYSKRIDRIDVSPDGIFKVYYADGVVYESDAFLKLLLSENTDIDLNSLISEGIASFTAEEVAEYLDSRYRDIFAKAEYSADLFADTDKPTFVKWDSATENTPYKAGLTTATIGFALVFGSKQADHTVISWAVGNDVKYSFNHRFIMSNDKGWDSYISSAGDVMSGPLGLGGGKGTVSADNEGSYIESVADNENGKRINVSHSVPIENAVSLIDNVNGEKVSYKLLGEHNLSMLDGIGYSKIKVDSYLGENSKTRKISGIPETAKFVLIVKDRDQTWKLFAIRGAEKTFAFWGSASQRNDVTWVGDTITLSNDILNSDTAYDVAMNEKDEKYWYVAIG